VRSSFLCGGRASHRKDWIKDRLLELSRCFAVEVGAFAIMDNHLHLLVRTQPGWAENWSDEEIVRRWIMLYPRTAERVRRAGHVNSDRELVRRLAADRCRVALWRQRLASLSWFMKCLKEPIARRANREDNVTGHFWNGRFKVQALLDDTAVLASLAYIDLNPVRAAVAASPEQSNHTSVQDRICVRQSHRAVRRQRCASRPRRVAALVNLPKGRRPAHDEDGIWLIPIEHRKRRRSSERIGLTQLTLDEYLQLIDLTGRRARPGKRGAIAKSLAPILDRLDVDAGRWLDEMLRRGRRVGSAIGSTTSLAREAARRGTRWVVGACPVYQGAS
jgi:REP element-mobilizing transposase RayT